MPKYDFQKIEKKWQARWEKTAIYKAKDNLSTNSGRTKNRKWYSLIEFPYPSGEGLHVGHVRSNTAMDIISRKRRMEGHDVLYPIGWDAFGLPTENYAIKTGVDPAVATKKNTDTFRRQLKSLGFSFDWSREINTTDPNYYKWTQWMFLQFFKHGLAYKASTTINWCPKDKIGLANEEAVGGVCDRCGGPVEKRLKEQWMLKITSYADKLLAGLKDIDYIPQAKIQQENWIGRSEGALIKFKLRGVPGQKDDQHFVEVFTTRPDTLFGATFVAISAELAKKWIDVGWQASDEVKKYVAETLGTRAKAEGTDDKEKTGVATGFYAVNPANQEEIPVWVVNYVLGDVGTGAIMAVPAHDERDFEFAKKFNLPIRVVISGGEEPYLGSGTLVNSGQFTGLDSETAKWEITKFVGGERKAQYKLRDWVFSRQRYWGEPIPLINCMQCGFVPVPEKDLPVKLPKVKNYAPRDDGESPLASVENWVNVKCPQCKAPAKRETDTMPNWAGSSWYFLRYIDPKNNKKFADPKKLKYWMPVDWYNGGMEHTVLHLLYSRFWNLVLYDLKLVPVKEPYKKRTSHGLILASGGVKMSKSKGNVINPDDIVKEFGADSLRLYEMFMGPFDQAIVWDTKGILGVHRFLERVSKLGIRVGEQKSTEEVAVRLVHQTVKKVAEDIEGMRFNTAISAMMILLNEFERHGASSRKEFEMFLKILAPFAPHLAEELWIVLGNKKSIHLEKWPKHNPKLLIEETFTLVIQVNGKVRDSVESSTGLSEAEAKKLALKREKIAALLHGKAPKKVIYIPNRLVNIVVES